MKADVGSHTEIVCPKCKSLLEFRAVDTNTLVTKIKERSQKKNKSNSAYTRMEHSSENQFWLTPGWFLS